MQLRIQISLNALALTACGKYAGLGTAEELKRFNSTYCPTQSSASCQTSFPEQGQQNVTSPGGPVLKIVRESAD